MHTTWLCISVSNGSGLPASVPVFAGSWVRFQTQPKNPTRFAMAGLLTGPDINPCDCARGGTAPRFNRTVPSTFAPLLPQVSIWVLIVLWHDQYAHCAVLCALSPSAFRFAIRPMFVESVWIKAKYEGKIGGYQSRLNKYWSDRISECGRWKSA